jgi:hypothetical protein
VAQSRIPARPDLHTHETVSEDSIFLQCLLAIFLYRIRAEKDAVTARGKAFLAETQSLAKDRALLVSAPGPTDRGLHGAPEAQHEQKEVHRRNVGKREQIARDVRIPISSQHP